MRYDQMKCQNINRPKCRLLCVWQRLTHSPECSTALLHLVLLCWSAGWPQDNLGWCPRHATSMDHGSFLQSESWQRQRKKNTHTAQTAPLTKACITHSMPRDVINVVLRTSIYVVWHWTLHWSKPVWGPVAQWLVLRFLWAKGCRFDPRPLATFRITGQWKKRRQSLPVWLLTSNKMPLPFLDSRQTLRQMQSFWNRNQTADRAASVSAYVDNRNQTADRAASVSAYVDNRNQGIHNLYHKMTNSVIHSWLSYFRD